MPASIYFLLSVRALISLEILSSKDKDKEDKYVEWTFFLVFFPFVYCTFLKERNKSDPLLLLNILQYVKQREENIAFDRY